MLRKASKALAASLGSSLGILFHTLLLNIIVSLDILPFPPFSVEYVHCCSVAQLYLTLCNSMDCSKPGFPVLLYLLELAQTQVYWVGDAIQQSHPLVSPFSSCLQFFPASGSFLMSWLFAWGGQSIGALASAPVFLMNIQDWSPLQLTGLILHSKGLSRVFSNTTVQKHQFFGAQLSLRSNSHIHIWVLEKP